MAFGLLLRNSLHTLRILTRKNSILYTTHILRVNNTRTSLCQALHTKVYDKDAGLDKQRDINKLQMRQEDLLFTPEELLKTVRRRSGRKASKRHSQAAVTDIAETEIKEEDKPLNLDLLVSINKDPDVFGNVAAETPEDEGDKVEEDYISRPTRESRKLRTKEYARLIKDHLNNHRLKDALDILEVRILKEDRAKPENYIYNLLISGCAKAGYTRKAFQLFTKMRQRGLKVKESTYTSLFNACANAPYRTDGIDRANRLREIMLEKGYEPNTKNYNAMIKAFGRWGDVRTAFLLADEMKEKKFVFTADTYNFLLQACASDREFGFRHCLLTWHKMLKGGIKPDYYSFNTVLRCTRDCGFGDLDTMQRALNEILDGPDVLQIAADSSDEAKAKETPLITTYESSSKVEKPENPFSDSENSSVQLRTTPNQTLAMQTQSNNLDLPNLLAPRPHLGSMVSLAEVQKPHERFLLLGGLIRFLELMKSCDITPDIQTFTSMLEVIPPTNAAEKQLLTFVRKIGLKADIDFFNVFIKKRAMRFDYEGGKEVLTMIETAGLRPDIVTYGVLALGCTTVDSSRELLQEMKNNGIRMNIEILGAMLRQGCAHKSFPYICEIIQISLDEHVKPNYIFLRHLDNFYTRCARAIDARHPWSKTKDFKKGHKRFCDKYRLYQEEHGILGLKLDDATKKLNQKPYDQFKEDTIDGLESIKNEKLSHKPKMRRYIKKIKIQNLKGDEDQFAHVSQTKSAETLKID
uniref:PPR_long domain-containing protein n=1 Tax=Glossina brevipalpis TaxID=37001 RepID=A0A1A9X0I1_9MUSC